MGLPQGFVLFPLLLNLFLADVFENFSSQKVKFADDETIWKTTDNLSTVEESLQGD
ncbi:hypothetical protein DPMN_170338 [Dreissena polymorpha]|uniref:Reverse transcriptase domain-containing protein n=1 Tax=Dreissena polymorpha TaxID=45954 RepID=A0A9D4DY66_DREPO|nr:hypothetical protein DPMN_170338 [Dreissena polymorpha]